jgi:hypothetical protein
LPGRVPVGWRGIRRPGPGRAAPLAVGARGWGPGVGVAPSPATWPTERSASLAGSRVRARAAVAWRSQRGEEAVDVARAHQLRVIEPPPCGERDSRPRGRRLCPADARYGPWPGIGAGRVVHHLRKSAPRVTRAVGRLGGAAPRRLLVGTSKARRGPNRKCAFGQLGAAGPRRRLQQR